MKYNLRSLMIVVLVLPPVLAGGWFGYRWLYPPFIGLPPALSYSEEERRELLRYLNELPRGEALFDPGSPPSLMPSYSAPAPNPPSREP